MLKKPYTIAIGKYQSPEVAKKPISNKRSWWTNQISKAVKEKYYLYSQCKFTYSDTDYAIYDAKRNQLQLVH